MTLIMPVVGNKMVLFILPQQQVPQPWVLYHYFLFNLSEPVDGTWKENYFVFFWFWLNIVLSPELVQIASF